MTKINFGAVREAFAEALSTLSAEELRELAMSSYEEFRANG